MRRCAITAILCILCGSAIRADENTDRARQLEVTGDAAGARVLLARAVQAAPSNLESLAAYAAFLERYSDPEARNAYRQLLAQSNKSENRTVAADAARRLVILDLLVGDRGAASTDLDAYHAAGGADWKNAALPGDRKSTRLNSSHRT